MPTVGAIKRAFEYASEKRWMTCPSCGKRRKTHHARVGHGDHSDKVTVECARCGHAWVIDCEADLHNNP